MSKRNLSAQALFTKAVGLLNARQPSAAYRLLRDLLDQAPGSLDVLQLSGAVCCELGKFDEALRHLSKAVTLAPGSAPARFNLGKALLLAGRPHDAIESYAAGLKISPNEPAAMSSYASALNQIGRRNAAIDIFQRAIKLDRTCVEAHDNLGRTLVLTGAWPEAAEAFKAAVALDPHHAETYFNLAEALQKLGLWTEADDAFRKGMQRAPLPPEANARAVRCQLRMCNWSKFESARKALLDAVGNGKLVSDPFIQLQIADTPELHKRFAIATAQKTRVQTSQPAVFQSGEKPKIKVAYLSADYKRHPTAHLIVGLFEQHDRQNFEIVGISIGGKDDGSQIGTRTRQAFDHFLDLADTDDAGVLKACRDLEIDIAVDLMAHTKHNRLALFAQRVAPIQVNMLGYPGTTGLPEMDYIITDRHVTPPSEARNLSEKPVVLPNCYAMNDDKRFFTDATPPRAQFGLPEQGVVFCCFNGVEKINPDVFRSWMRILGAVEGSVLWLFSGDDLVIGNLRSEAKRAGIAPERLIFGGRLPFEEHFTRYRVADLFLDTFPYNAHTTASDALWAGCPVLTRSGASFASRVAGSLLHTIGVPDLITTTVEDYERLAIKLAHDPEMLAGLRERIERNRLTSPLFDTALYARDIEQAFRRMYDLHRAGQTPQAIDLSGPDRGPAG